jgi:hypothetical protein
MGSLDPRSTFRGQIGRNRHAAMLMAVAGWMNWKFMKL